MSKQHSLSDEKLDNSTSPQKRRLKTSSSSRKSCTPHVYQLNLYYCISFNYTDLPVVVSIIKNNSLFSGFDPTFTLNTQKSQILLTENSDQSATYGVLFIRDMCINTNESTSSSTLSVDIDIEKMLALQAEFAHEVKLMKEFNKELKRVVGTHLGWKVMVCRWDK